LCRNLIGSILATTLAFSTAAFPVLAGFSAFGSLPSTRVVKTVRGELPPQAKLETVTKKNNVKPSQSVCNNNNSQPPVATDSKTAERNNPTVVVPRSGPATPAVQPTQTGRNWEYQFQMLARIISAEAKGEPLAGQVAVGAVILNRVESGKFPNSIAQNVLKPGEFEPVANGQIWAIPSKSAYQAARLALNGWDPTYGALYFYNPAKTSSRWIWSRPVILRIGGHVFAG